MQGLMEQGEKSNIDILVACREEPDAMEGSFFAYWALLRHSWGDGVRVDNLKVGMGCV